MIFLGCAATFEVFLLILISILKKNKLDEHRCSCSAAVVLCTVESFHRSQIYGNLPRTVGVSNLENDF